MCVEGPFPPAPASGDLTRLALALVLGGLPGKPLASSRDVVRGEASG